jgi:hypothetical protein
MMGKILEISFSKYKTVFYFVNRKVVYDFENIYQNTLLKILSFRVDVNTRG